MRSGDLILFLFLGPALAVFCGLAFAQQSDSKPPQVLVGSAAYGDWRQDRPGLRRKITPQDLPAPSTNAVDLTPIVVKQPRDVSLKAPDGFEAELFASGLIGPRTMRIAPNGDVFVAESDGNRVRVLRVEDGAAKPSETSVFASDLDFPFGLAFYPPGPEPRWLYVATTTQVVRFPYRNGDLKASGKAEIVVRSLPGGGHVTRDLVFSPDGKTMFVSVGSYSNVGERLARLSVPEIDAFEKMHGTGAAWGFETDRADVLAFDQEGREKRAFATGLRNCAAMTIQPASGWLWCAVNERDLLGDDLPPEFATRVEQGGFYGWPWYYIGKHIDPRHAGARPDLEEKVVVPDVLLQPHSAPLGIAFYDGAQFPAEYRGDAFVALHGSWNRAKRTGYKVVRLIFRDGKPTGEYEDFLVGFVLDDARVWGRPVGVAVMRDGSLLMSEDGNGTIWRVSYAPEKSDQSGQPPSP
jgi:glucose/arabinose dehydrogenase